MVMNREAARKRAFKSSRLAIRLDSHGSHGTSKPNTTDLTDPMNGP
jgi:hypothetical protein